ncbi:MAG: hypothetical protein AABY00_02135 [Nanoarchaeota archaeon]
MVVKWVGYIVAFVGIIGLACATMPPLRNAFSLSSTVSNTLMPLSLVVVVVGAVMVYLSASKSKKGTEVPIYEGKNVVGYRRI